MVETALQDIEPAAPVAALDALPVLMAYAEADGDISTALDESTMSRIVGVVCQQYERDKVSREKWEKVASKALEDMVRCDFEAKTYPWPNSSNVHYPLLAFAVMQFNARAYPAIIKGDEAVSVKVVGNDNGQPAMMMTPQGPMPAINPQTGQVMQWQREPGAKAKRAQRVREYMNTTLFYRMDDWETETDTLLFQLPAIGIGFRKVWYDGNKHQSRFIPALRVVVDNDAKSLADAPQIAEEIDGVFPHHIRRDISSGRYRPIVLDPNDHEARMLIEAQAYFDLDGDRVDEPYIVTIDYKDKTLLRVVPDFGPEQVKLIGNRLAFIERRTFYVKYEFLPNPEGKFYNPGLAHLLEQYGSVIDTLINQMLDANHAATAGGGFIASGLSIQGRGQSSSLRYRPGEYKTVSVSGDQLRNGIVERTTPQLSPVAFSLLDLILGAAKDIASVKDVLSGDASNNGQVGTTLALIEQGLQVFTAVYKRVYRGLKAEFKLLYDNIALYADEETVRDYSELLDDPQADFVKDFAARDMDIRPVSDPSSVTKMQKMGRAQFLLGTVETLAAVGGDPKEALRRMYEAADVEDIDKLLPPPPPQAGMAMEMDMANKAADLKAKEAKAALDEARAVNLGAKTVIDGQAANDKTDLEEAKLALKALEVGVGYGAA